MVRSVIIEQGRRIIGRGLSTPSSVRHSFRRVDRIYLCTVQPVDLVLLDTTCPFDTVDLLPQIYVLDVLGHRFSTPPLCSHEVWNIRPL